MESQSPPIGAKGVVGASFGVGMTSMIANRKDFFKVPGTIQTSSQNAPTTTAGTQKQPSAITPPSNADEEEEFRFASSPTSSQEDSPPPPAMILRRQNSDVSAWLSEVDSQYHEHDDDDLSEDSVGEEEDRVISHHHHYDRSYGLDDSKSLALSEIDSQVLSHKTPRKVSPDHASERKRRDARSYMSQQSGGDDTSEATPIRRNARGMGSGRTETNALIKVYQDRLQQAEERASIATQRLNKEERTNRQVAQDLREANWETSRLEDIVQEQAMKIVQLEGEQGITQAWSKKAEPTEQDRALVRDLQTTQDKLLKVEQSKMQLLKELAGLQKSTTEERDSLTGRIEDLDRKVFALESEKNDLEQQLQESLEHAEILERASEHAKKELEKLKLETFELKENNAALKRRVRFADEEAEAATVRHQKLQEQLENIQKESEAANQRDQDEIFALQTSITRLEWQKKDLYESLQQTLESKTQTEEELDILQRATADDQQKVEKLTSELETTKTQMRQNEINYEAQMAKQKEIVMTEQLRADSQNKELQDKLDGTLLQAKETQKALESSEGKLELLKLERQDLLNQQKILEEKLDHQIESWRAGENERRELLKTLNMNDVESKALLKQQEAEANAREAESTKAHEVVLEALETKKKEVSRLETEVEAMKVQTESMLKEKEMLVVKAAELQNALLDEGPQKELASTYEELERLKDVVEALEDEKTNMLEKMNVSQNRVQALEMELQSVRDEQKPLQELSRSATQRASSLEEKLRGAQAQFDNLHIAHQELQDEHSLLLKKYNKDLENIKSLEERQAESKMIIQTLENKRSELEEEIDCHSRKIDVLETKHSEAVSLHSLMEKRMRQEKTDLESSLALSTSEVVKMKTLTSSLESRLDSQKSQHVTTLSSIQTSNQTELKSLHTNLSSIQKTLKNEQTARKADMEAAQTQMRVVEADLQEALTSRKNTEAALKNASEKVESLSSRLQTSEATIAYLETELQSSKSEAEWLTIDKETLTKLNKNVESKLEELEAKVQNLEGEKEELTNEVARLRTENSELLLQCNKAIQLQTNLEVQLSESKAFNIKLGEQLSEKQEKLLTLQKSDEKLRNEIEVLLVKMKELESENEKIASEKAALLTKYDETTRISTVQEESNRIDKEALKQQLTELEASYELASSERAAVEERLQASTKMLDKIEKQVVAAERKAMATIAERDQALETVSKYEDENDVLQKKIHDLEIALQESHSGKTVLLTEKQSLSDELKTILSQLDELRNNNKIADAHQDKLQSQCSSLQEEIDALKEEKNALLSKNSADAASMLASTEAFEAEKSNLGEKISLLESEKFDLIEALQGAKKNIEELERKVCEIEKETSSHRANSESSQQNLLAVTEEKELLQTQLLALQVELHAARDGQNEALQAAEEAKDQLVHLRSKSVKDEKEKADLYHAQTQLERNIDDYSSKLAAAEAKTHELQVIIEDLEKKNRVLSQDAQSLASVAAKSKPSEKLTRDLSEANTFISKLQKENEELSSRLSFSEVTVETLKSEFEKTITQQSEAIKELSETLAITKKSMKKMSKELKASEEQNIGLKRAARYLVKRIRELEVGSGILEDSFELSLDVASTPEKKQKRSSLAKPQSIVADVEGSIRVVQRPIFLSMHYRDTSGEPQSYEVSAKFTGPLLNGLPNGPGMLRFDNKDVFLGEFENGEMNGVGTFSRRHKLSHANKVLFGSFSNKDTKGKHEVVPPISRVTARTSST